MAYRYAAVFRGFWREQPQPNALSKRRIERCVYCLHSKRNHTIQGRIGACQLEGCNCPAFMPEAEP
jgi:hypothetical protein